MCRAEVTAEPEEEPADTEAAAPNPGQAFEKLPVEGDCEASAGLGAR